MSSTASGPPTLGTFARGVANTPLATAVAIPAFAAVLAGSFGPWFTAGIQSPAGRLMLGPYAGIHGDGKLSGVAAGVGIAAILFRTTWLVRRPLSGIAGLAALVAAGVGIYDWINLHKHVRQWVYLGQHVDHLDWGIYLVALGGIVAILALSVGWLQEQTHA